MQFWSILKDSLRESRDRKIFWLMIGISVLTAFAMLSVQFSSNSVSFFFGAIHTPTQGLDPAQDEGRSRIVAGVVYILMDTILSWVGILLMIVATAGFFPAFMERGKVDVVLAKPIGRARLFLYKYVASMVFVLVQALVFVGLTLLVMGLHWRVWVPSFLVAVPLLVLQFSYLYCVSVAVAVTTRSTLAAILITIAAWVAFTVPGAASNVISITPELRSVEWLRRTVEIARWIPPKTGDIPYLAARCTRAAPETDLVPDEALSRRPGQAERVRVAAEQQAQVDPWASIGSSLLFEAALVGLALWRFRARDF